MSHYPDEYELERSFELERRLDRDEEREPFVKGKAAAIRRAVASPNPAANANSGGPIVVLEPTGDGASLYRALARVIVRRELNIAIEISRDTGCETAKAA